MKKYPFIKQLGLKDCGVTCLKMIIKYYGGDYQIEKLRQITNTTKDGTSAYDLIEGAKKIGFDSVGYSVCLEDISDKILPVIAYTVIDNSYQHYVVIYEIDHRNKQLVIADPAIKIKKIKFEEFNKIFKNVILTFNPRIPLPIYKENCFMKMEIKDTIKKYRKRIFLITILILLSTILSIMLTLSIKVILDNINNSFNIITITYTYILISIFRFILEHIKNFVFLKFNKRVELNVYNKIIEKYLFLPYEYYRNQTTGEIVSKIQNIEKVSEHVTVTFSNLFINSLIIIITSLIIFYLHPLILTILLIFTIIICLIFILFQKIKNKYIKQNIIKKDNLNSYLTEAINGFETVKGLNIENNILDNLKLKNNSYIENKIKINKLNLIEDNLQNLIYTFGNGIFILIGYYLINSNILSISDFVLFLTLYSYYYSPFINIIKWIEQQKEIKIIIEHIDSSIIENKNKSHKFNNDFFEIKYQDIDIKIKQGEKIMLLGESGAGKSTLLKNIKGYYKNNNLDIIYISQNEILFTDTIKNNLLLGNNNEKELNKVINLCYINNILDKKKLGYNTLIEENGYNLSGGEKQRIVLARALLKNPKILLIDEGLSEVDIKLENCILRNIIDNYKNMTVLFVSHRKDNDYLFNRTITLKGGI